MNTIPQDPCFINYQSNSYIMIHLNIFSRRSSSLTSSFSSWNVEIFTSFLNYQTPFCLHLPTPIPPPMNPDIANAAVQQPNISFRWWEINWLPIIGGAPNSNGNKKTFDQNELIIPNFEHKCIHSLPRCLWRHHRPHRYYQIHMH